jgi:hypothetical protein
MVYSKAKLKSSSAKAFSCFRPFWIEKLYNDISFATAMSKPALYILLTFRVPNLISIFFSLGRLFKESMHVRDPF